MVGTQRIIVFILVFLSATLFLPQPSLGKQQCKAWLVQSIPTDMTELRLVPGVLSTADVFQWLAGNSTRTLDVTAQYWQLLAQPDNPQSGDYGYSAAQMEEFGAYKGAKVFQAIADAGDRKVSVRLLSNSGVYPDYTEEATELAAGRPTVKNVTLLLSKWWGTGIIHTKVWISDHRDVYIGSANNDWKSLTQVKELGIYLVGCPKIAKIVGTYFNNLWKLSTLDSTAYTRKVWDEEWQINRLVPCWSHFIDPKARCRSPLPRYVDTPHVPDYPVLSDPYKFELSIETPGINGSTLKPYFNYLSFAPPELLFGTNQADLQAWVDAIKSVKFGGTVRMSTMDWLGQSEYTTPTIYWSSLSSAISEVIFSKNATVKLLVGYWTHSISNTDQYLNALLYSNVLCSSSKYNHCGGKVEVRYYIVPGYKKTGPAKFPNGTSTGNIYPGYTRVNHAKYAVSDTVAHVGTSNLVWDYFFSTAGVSFGTHNPAIVYQLQEAFDADWNSPYVVPVKTLQDS